MNIKTFTKEKLNNELFNRIVYYEYVQSSGLGGEGTITAITNKGEEYMVDATIMSDLEIIVLFPDLNQNMKKLDTNRWVEIPYDLGAMYIRKEYYKRFSMLIGSEEKSMLYDRARKFFCVSSSKTYLYEECYLYYSDKNKQKSKV